MAVFRIAKNKNYTVMSNYHLNDYSISLKAKGLMSQILSLPEDWDYSLEGLAKKNKEKVDAIRTAVEELEEAGYIKRRRIRNANGTLGGIEYIIYEQPTSGDPELETPILENPTLVNPKQGMPSLDAPTLDYRGQLNTNKQNTNKQNTSTSSASEKKSAKEDDIREQIASNIEFADLMQCPDIDHERLWSIYEIMCSIACSTSKTIRINSADVPSDEVKSVFWQLRSEDIKHVLAVLGKQRDEPIVSFRRYLPTLLYNAKDDVREQLRQAETKKEKNNETQVKKMGFNNFRQNDYDFDALEQKLISN